MADWTLGTDSNLYHGKSRKGAASPVIQYYQESTCPSTEVIKRGDVVSQDTNVTTGGFRVRRGYLGGGNESNLLGVGQHILGVAVETSTSDGAGTNYSSGAAPMNHPIGVVIADLDTEYVGYLASTAATKPVSASSLIGLERSVRYDSTNHIYTIDNVNSTVALRTVKITGIPDGTDGDTNGPVYFKFLSSNISEAVL